MTELTVEKVIQATGGELLTKDSVSFQGVSIDTRTIKEGDLFFAIRGERFDGHDFLEDALAKGAGAVVDTKPGIDAQGKILICVSDTLRSLQDLAHYLRNEKDIPVVAVTGSNGKTTTKEMIYSILSKKFRTLKNEGNLNNHIGLPLSLMRLDRSDEMIVLEMGMNASGEIRRLCEIARPTHGVITNVGAAHLGMLGSYEAVRDAKLEIAEGLKVLAVNADDRFLMEGVKDVDGFHGETLTFALVKTSHGGSSDYADVTAWALNPNDRGIDFTLECIGKGSVDIRLNVHGLFNVYNALAAAAVCFTLGLELDDIKAGLESYASFPMRFEITDVNGMTVINDAYNANLTSTKESVLELVRMGSGGRKIAVLGDMLELGMFTEQSHRDIGNVLVDLNVDVFVAVGEKMGIAAEECIRSRGVNKIPDVFCFSDSAKAAENIKGIVKEHDTVLVKGSRSMSMEKVIEELTDAV